MSDINLQINIDNGSISQVTEIGSIKNAVVNLRGYQVVNFIFTVKDRDGNVIDLSGDDLSFELYLGESVYDDTLIATITTEGGATDPENGIIDLKWTPVETDISTFLDGAEYKPIYATLRHIDALNTNDSVFCTFTIQLENLIYLSPDL